MRDSSAGAPVSGRYRVLMVDPACYSPFYDVPLCRQLRAHGVDVRLLTSRFHYDGTRADGDVGDACFYPLTSRLPVDGAARRLVAGLEHPLGWMSVLARLSRAGAPTIVHSQWLPLPFIDVAILCAARAAGAVWVHTVHDLEPRRESRGSVAGFRRAYRSADHLLVHCQDTAHGLTTRFGVSGDRVSRVAVGASLEGSGELDRTAARKRLDLPRDGRLALFFGVLRESKGLEVLVAAISRLAARHRDLRLAIVGRPQGLGRREILGFARKCGLDEARVILRLAYVPNSEVPLYFGAADFVVFPYLKADQSAALTLALANGRAAVVSRVGGLPDLVEDGVTGRIVPPGDVAALAAAIEDLLSDGGRTEAMGRAAAALAARKLSWDLAAKQTAAAYETALRTRRAALR